VWKEKVAGLTLKIFNSVREYHTFCIPHRIRIIIDENTAKRKKKGYSVLLNACILTVIVFTNTVRVEN